MDLYHIPNDTGGDWRMRKFVEYAHGAPTVCHPTIIEYSRRAGWGEDKFLTAAFLHCLFYEELTAISTVQKYGTDIQRAIQSWDKKRPHTNPDKRRVVNMRLYPAAVNGWVELTEGSPHSCIRSIETRVELRRFITKIKNIGGFSADLFENCLYNAGYNFGKRYPEWNSTPRLAIGMYLILYQDERAKQISLGKSVSKEDEVLLSNGFETLCKYMERTHPGSPPEVWYTKLCSWSNLFNGTRYGGYHHDRQLENLLWHETNEPEQYIVWKRVYNLRKKLWSHNMLGELHDWSGVRPERKKLWLKEGLTGVEAESPR